MPPLNPQQLTLVRKIVYLLIILAASFVAGFFGGCTGYLKLTREGSTVEVGGTIDKPSKMPGNIPASSTPGN